MFPSESMKLRDEHADARKPIQQVLVLPRSRRDRRSPRAQARFGELTARLPRDYNLFRSSDFLVRDFFALGEAK